MDLYRLIIDADQVDPRVRNCLAALCKLAEVNFKFLDILLYFIAV